ncbi:MAG TPA: M14 family zinc carboxypeptidase [Solirubrobacterales bacterium]|nr:M14 family zinc carboxypeptidase [Solirubrobacterales bacterium]
MTGPRFTLAIATAVSACALLSAGADAKGLDTTGAVGGVAAPGSPFRYQALMQPAPKAGNRWTTVLRIARNGGEVSRWWHLRGSWMVPAAAYDGSGTGISADGRRLVLAAFRYAYPRPSRWTTRLAILDTGPHPRRRPGTGSTPLSRAPVARFVLPGDLRPLALSPDGSRLYLAENVKPGYPGNYAIREMDTSSGRLLPGALFDSRWARSGIQAIPITALADGRRLYTLYYGRQETVYLQVLDTARRAVFTKPLPQLTGLPNPMMLTLRLGAHRQRLLVRGRPPELARRAALLSIATRGFAVHARPVLRRAVAAARFLAFAKTPQHRSGGIGLWVGVVGRSAGGRPILLKELGDRHHRGRVLVFGCIHGDECAARHLQPLGGAGCPDPDANIYLVPNLDPDGSAESTRLNGDGVDLNRNFSVGWRPIGGRGDPEYSGPQPFSEPETRLAARIVRHLRPRVTIWFHQHLGPRPFVRAWGQSVPAARRFARLAGIRFKRLPWLDGTAPHWQNRRFPGTSSYVVELPPGPLAPGLQRRLERAIDRIGRREAKVGED